MLHLLVANVIKYLYKRKMNLVPWNWLHKTHITKDYYASLLHSNSTKFNFLHISFKSFKVSALQQYNNFMHDLTSRCVIFSHITFYVIILQRLQKEISQKELPFKNVWNVYHRIFKKSVITVSRYKFYFGLITFLSVDDFIL